jgi:Fe-S-cluster containining protein
MTNVMINNECLSLCSLCGGECCKTKPGIEWASRFIDTADPYESLMQCLSSGLWVLERHYGIPGRQDPVSRETITYYPRPATRNENKAGVIFSAGEPGDCIFLNENGCDLAFELRPHMCQTLEPDVIFECSSSWTRLDAALDWLPHQPLLAQVLKALGHFHEQFKPDPS